MRFTVFAVFLAVSFLIAGNVSAYDSRGGYTAFGGTCGQWLGIPRGDWTRLNWLDGYRTAVNLLAKGKGNFFEGTDAVSVELYVDNFCRENPLKGIGDAMVAMLKELKVALGR